MDMPEHTEKADNAEAIALLTKLINKDINAIKHVGDRVLGFETISSVREVKNRTTDKITVATITPASGSVFVWDYEETKPHLTTPPSLQRSWK